VKSLRAKLCKTCAIQTFGICAFLARQLSNNYQKAAQSTADQKASQNGTSPSSGPAVGCLQSAHRNSRLIRWLAAGVLRVARSHRQAVGKSHVSKHRVSTPKSTRTPRRRFVSAARGCPLRWTPPGALATRQSAAALVRRQAALRRLCRDAAPAQRTPPARPAATWR
jgi:hypothetical protein